MAAEAPVEIEIKEDAKPLLPGVGVLIDTERLAAGREDVYYIVIYGKRYYGSTPEDVVVRTKRYVQEKGPIPAPVKTSMFSRFGTRRASANSPSSEKRGFTFKVPSFGRSSSVPKASGSKGWGLPSVKLPSFGLGAKSSGAAAASGSKGWGLPSVSLPSSFGRKAKTPGPAPAGAAATPPAKNKPLPTPATGNAGPKEETNEEASARLKASFNANNSLKGVKIGQLEGSISVPKPGQSQIKPGEFNNWDVKEPAKEPDPFAAQGSGKQPGGKVPNVNLQDGGARKPGPRRVTRRPRSMFTKPRRKHQRSLAPTH